ncbi:helix-turn-helix domain-containing protein [Limobrevibacterium gyesilva]|uniref:Helix-turn-helix domain-containing protein n=1 Tax=Limobrevibacterium gyesilva TaxID=2991712 RepID=A0AA41YNY2_9PROT|nr:helix-turn-helix domain-containing protein [Limobrevibacterium gyesilva]MCW3477404.1 helix-turn-helix domain-containing protein [Limobrevibacterium gyesilva]
MISTRDLIARLGGGAAVARRLGVSAAAVCNWIASDQIPAGRVLALWALAVEAGIDWRPADYRDYALVRVLAEAA